MKNIEVEGPSFSKHFGKYQNPMVIPLGLACTMLVGLLLFGVFGNQILSVFELFIVWASLITGFLTPTLILGARGILEYVDQVKIYNTFTGVSPPPHETIDDFLKWEVGDKVKIVDNYDDKVISNYYFQGVLDDHRLVFSYYNGIERSGYTSDQVVTIGSNLFNFYDVTNVSLKRRENLKELQQIKDGVESSSYMEFLETVKEEFKKQQNDHMENENEELESEEVESHDELFWNLRHGDADSNVLIRFNEATQI